LARRESNDAMLDSRTTGAKRILIADDHDVVRSGLRSILESHEGWNVVGEAENGRDAITLIVEKVPDVAIVDYSLPLINGVEVTRSVKARQLATEVLIFTMHDSDELVKESFKAGAKAFLLKSDAGRLLVAAVESLVLHKPFLTGPVSEKMLASFLSSTGAPKAVISPRERMVIQLISEGYSNKGMSKILNLSIKTIETHRASAMRKLEVNSTAALVRYAIRNRLVEP
jgi:DNA-binding NarL/FixJ family response regulator